MEIISGSVSFPGRFGDHCRAGDHLEGCTSLLVNIQEKIQHFSTTHLK